MLDAKIIAIVAKSEKNRAATAKLFEYDLAVTVKCYQLNSREKRLKLLSSRFNNTFALG